MAMYAPSLLERTERPQLGFVARADSARSTVAAQLARSYDQLQYLRAEPRLLRTVTILKSRGSAHEPEIREFDITPGGIVSEIRSSASRFLANGRGPANAGPLSYSEVRSRRLCLNELAHLLHYDLAGGDLRRVREHVLELLLAHPVGGNAGGLVGVLGRVVEADRAEDAVAGLD
jgi:hypothetical protein